jgi:hypothetical protein
MTGPQIGVFASPLLAWTSMRRERPTEILGFPGRLTGGKRISRPNFGDLLRYRPPDAAANAERRDPIPEPGRGRADPARLDRAHENDVVGAAAIAVALGRLAAAWADASIRLDPGRGGMPDRPPMGAIIAGNVPRPLRSSTSPRTGGRSPTCWSRSTRCCRGGPGPWSDWVAANHARG